jgi:amino acid adenylation domain-containing protein
VSWNATGVEYRAGRCVHELIEEQVERTPEAVAVEYEGREVTYRELNRRANQLAHFLRGRGVGPEVAVGVCAERSVEMVVSLLGILKAGGAYVPLDPTYPADRLASMVQDARIPVVLTQRHLVAGLPAWGAELLCVDERSPELDAQPEANPASGASDSALAYVIYTSGSTGKPKGAMNIHRGFRNRLLWMQDAFRLDASDVVLQKTPYSFDVSVWEFFWPLLVGARLVVARPGGHKDSAYLARLIAATGVTTLHFVPSMLYAFVEEPGLAECRSLKRVICSGEALPYELQERFFARSGAELHNLYGPTEASIDVTWWACRRGDSRPLVPIGRPIANTQLYVVDSAMRPSAVGVPGELCIGGIGVGRGYLQRPALTAEKFIPDPFSQLPGARLYRTGDLARWLPDGSLDYLGRIDNQVKVRGFRIELGEIEAVLGQHPALREVAVLARADGGTDKRLVAYLVPREAPAPAPSELRSFLQQKLPEYMVPAVFVALDAMPLTSSGKVDRRSLPAPDGARPDDAAFVPPRDPVELTLARLWEDHLDVRPVGARDDFFALGGHSLLAVRLLAAVHERFGQALPLTLFFQRPTVEEMARQLREGGGSRPWSPLVEIQPGRGKRPLFLVHPGGGTVLCYAELARQLGPDRPVYGLQARGAGDGQEPNRTIEAMAAQYIEAMRTVQPSGPYLLGGWSLGGLVAFEMSLQLLRDGQQVDFLAIIDTPARMDPEEYGTWDDAVALSEMADLQGIQVSAEELRPLEPEEQLRRVMQRAVEAHLVLPGVDVHHIRHWLKLFRTHHQAALSYVPRLYPGTVTLLRAQEPRKTAAGTRRPASTPDRTLGWGAFSSRPVDVHDVPGDHESLVKEPYVQPLAMRLNACLLAVEPPPAGSSPRGA